MQVRKRTPDGCYLCFEEADFVSFIFSARSR